MEYLVVPVIGSVIILAVRITESGLRVKLEVGADKLFAFGKRVNKVTYTTVVLIENILVSKCV